MLENKYYLPRKFLRRSFGATSIFATLISTVGAEEVATFYRGRSIELVVSSTPGGGYDAMARSYARHMPKHIPGSPSIIVRNMPGGGGLTAANYLYNTAPRDGTSIAAVHQGVAFQPLFGEKQARYDAEKFSWIGNANSETGVYFVWHTSKVNTIVDAFSTEIMSAATDGGSTTAFTYRLLNGLLGTKIKTVTGYPGSNESFLALERGEVEGFFTVWTSVKAKPALLNSGKLRVLVQVAIEKSAALQDVPLATDYLKTSFDRDVFELSVAPGTLGRPYIGAPAIPSDRLEALRAAFIETSKDPVFRLEIEQMGLEVDNPMPGRQAKALIQKIYKSPSNVIAKVTELTKSER